MKDFSENPKNFFINPANSNPTGNPPAPNTSSQSQPHFGVFHPTAQSAVPSDNKMNINDKKQAFQSYYNKVNQYNFSKDLVEIVPQIKTLEKLLEYESKIDKILSKKKVDIQEQLLRPFPKIKRILRVHVYNAYTNSTEENTGWILRIEGKLLNNEKNGSTSINRKFSYFFRHIQIVFDEGKNPNYKNIIWKKQNMSSETDALEIKRTGNKEMEVEISLHLYSNPQKYKLNEKLSNILGYTHASRATVLSALWEYIKLNRLQDKENRNIINNDANLRLIFECDKMAIDTLTLRLKSLLEAPQPIVLKHQLKLNGDVADNENFYDIVVEYDYPIHFELMPFMGSRILDDNKHQTNKTNPDNLLIKLAQNLKKYEKQSSDLLEQINRHKFKKDCYESYAKNPELFIENVVVQQNQLLKIMNNRKDLKRKFDDFNDPEFLLNNEELVEKEIRKYIEEKQTTTT